MVFALALACGPQLARVPAALFVNHGIFVNHVNPLAKFPRLETRRAAAHRAPRGAWEGPAILPPASVGQPWTRGGRLAIEHNPLKLMDLDGLDGLDGSPSFGKKKMSKGAPVADAESWWLERGRGERKDGGGVRQNGA